MREDNLPTTQNERMKTQSRRGGVALSIFKGTLFAFSPLIRLWAKTVGRGNYMRMRGEIVNDMKWTIANLNPTLISVGDGEHASLRYTTIILQSTNYNIKITRESYYGGDDFVADVASSRDPGKYFRVEVVIRIIERMMGIGGKEERRILLRTLADLDALIHSIDTLLKDYFSEERYQTTRKEIETYIWTDWHNPK